MNNNSAADKPLQVGTANRNDKLSRGAYVKAAVSVINRANNTEGIVTSVEGTWGSGKSSTLSMIEEMLLANDPSAVIVHFNPWLVGGRDALLQKFLSTLASSIKMKKDTGELAKTAAKAIEDYSKAFDVIQLIPAAQPYAAVARATVSGLGSLLKFFGKNKGIEEQKERVEKALREFSRPIIVFIDDIDRLFPLEVFEMVRIIKAVGEFPRVAYVLAWDPAYVNQALASAQIPNADSYLDKIVQVRMPLPRLSISAKAKLLNDALLELSESACASYFPNQDVRRTRLYYTGFGTLLEQPRDVIRVFNSVALIEPGLRGEIVLADIIALCALMVKAPAVFELLKKSPRFFVADFNDGQIIYGAETVETGSDQRQKAIEKCQSPTATQSLIHHLFPDVAEFDKKATTKKSYLEGHLANPTRLQIALQMSVNSGDISIVTGRQYLTMPDERERIALSLNTSNIKEFIEMIGGLASSYGRAFPYDLERLCLELASLIDMPHLQEDYASFGLSTDTVAEQTIEQAIKANNLETATRIARIIVESRNALTLSSVILATSYFYEKESRNVLICDNDENLRSSLLQNQKEAILARINDGSFFNIARPSNVLWTQARLLPESCQDIFTLIKSKNSLLDLFALYFLHIGTDSTKGSFYGLPDDSATLNAYCSLSELKQIAKMRLLEPMMDYPVKAAWLAVTEEKQFYGIDGTSPRFTPGKRPTTLKHQPVA